MGKILVILEKNKNSLKRVSFELITAAINLSKANGSKVAGLYFGNAEGIPSLVGEYGLEEVININNSNLDNYSSTGYAKAIAQVATSESADIILFPANAMGSELAPRVAVKLNAGYIADSTKLEIVNNELIVTKPIYAGMAISTNKILKAIKIISLRPKAFTAQKSNSSVNTIVKVFNADISPSDLKVKVIETKVSEGKLDLTEADVVVAGGRGLKSSDNFTMLEELASILGGTVGASRAVTDEGWRPASEQIGQTGKTVSPSLYISIAISGAIQHVSGMNTSKVILSINKDKDAPIFKISDYGIVGDLFQVLPKFTEKVKALKD